MEWEKKMGEPMLLRGHHFICIQGFRGYGYSKEFVDGMWAVVNLLKERPETVVEITDSSDQICQACPYRDAGKCPEAGKESEAKDAGHDQRVLERLGLEVGQKVAWSTVLDRIRSSVEPDDLHQLCRNCQWMPAGYCAAGLKSLRGSGSPSPQASE